MTIMAQKIQLENYWTGSNQHSVKETIHSGHFMVSEFEAEEQDEDDLGVPVPEEVEIRANILNNQIQSLRSDYLRSEKSGHQVSIETSLSKLFQCMSLAYRQKLTSPKWNRFKGIRLRWKDKIRLNNVIWRCWHIQFINRKKTLVCQFASPLDVDTHNKPEAVVLEGKYWKRKLNAVTAEYKKWRMYSHNQILGKPQKNHDVFTDLDSQECWPLNCSDNMMVDEDYMGLMTDTLFSTITAQPFAFPDPREIARNTNLADFIQPSLVQLQPNLDEIMEIEPLHDLLQSSKLVALPEDNAVLQSVPSYSTKLSASAETISSNSYPTNTYVPSETIWYLPPEFGDLAEPTPPPVSANLPPPYPQTRMTSSATTSLTNRQPMSLNTQNVVASPSSPPPPMLSKSEVFTPPKNKTKGRTRNSVAKRMSTYNTSNQQQPIALPVMALPSSQQQQQQLLQEQSNQSKPSSLQSSTLLAQILTSNSSTSYGFGGKDQPSQNAPSSKLTPMTSNSEELTSYIQHSFRPISSQALYKSDSNLRKSNKTFVINNEKASANVSSQRNVAVPSHQSPVFNKSPVQPPINNMGNICSDPLGTPEHLSLSPLNVGSPTSPPSSKEAPPMKEQRRVCHINAEQKRRCNIKNGFDTLHSLIPQLSQNPNAKMSKASMLQKGAEYIRQLRIERSHLKQEVDSLRQEIDSLNTAICNCQAMLPATGAPISRQRNNKFKDMFKQYVKIQTHKNWKFWLLSLICEPLLESFNNCVSTNSLDELYHSTLQWVDQHCTLVILRQVVLNSLRQLCTTTEVLTDPARLPTEAKTAVDKPNKKQS